jgi:hypothetical protein
MLEIEDPQPSNLAELNVLWPNQGKHHASFAGELVD